ncbi:MAG: hypothetical protein ACXVI0_08665, partial [Halobacteriota archaeon]
KSSDSNFNPDKVFVTSLFTYAWRPVHRAVRYYKTLYPNAHLTLGGIYASLLPDHALTSGADYVHVGQCSEADVCPPAWELVPEWDGSIIIVNRGCIRSCPFCAVPRLEGGFRPSIDSIKWFVYPKHKRIIFWDNNILAGNWQQLFEELIELKRWVDFNQGLDARLIDNKVAQQLAQLKMEYIRLAYDDADMQPSIEQAIKHLKNARIRARKIVVYTLYNFKDTPEDFKHRVQELLEWGVASYPMRYEPPTALTKNQFVGKWWSQEELEMVADARRVLGSAGTFPPYAGLVQKFQNARNFHEALELRPVKGKGQLLQAASKNTLPNITAT